MICEFNSSTWPSDGLLPPPHATIYINDMLMAHTKIMSFVGSDLFGPFIPQGYL